MVRPRLEAIPRDECLRLLADHHLGRLAVVVGDQPLVFPVNYALSGTQVVFRSDPGTKLHSADGKKVAFEIDGADALYHEGWSVLVVGEAYEEHDAMRLRAFEALPLMPWGPGPKSHWMCIRGAAVTGRRLVHEVSNAGQEA
jgi:nitroimidazol reductase NimA-like FMN-containing flavoprotein (pyridoxamine 5'-phosphate oxidase superfamily)